MPNSIVLELIARIADLEKKVAVLMSWHKVQTTLLGLVLAACVKIIWSR